MLHNMSLEWVNKGDMGSLHERTGHVCSLVYYYVVKLSTDAKVQPGVLDYH